MAIRTAAAILLLLIALPAWSQSEDDGNELLRECEAAIRGANQDDMLKGIACWGYRDALAAWSVVQAVQAGGATKPYCLPRGNIPNDQAARIVVKYLEENPNRLHQHRAALVMSALMDAFPCR